MEPRVVPPILPFDISYTIHPIPSKPEEPKKDKEESLTFLDIAAFGKKILLRGVHYIHDKPEAIATYNREWRMKHAKDTGLVFNRFVPICVTSPDLTGKQIVYLDLPDLIKQFNYPESLIEGRFKADSEKDPKSINLMKDIFCDDTPKVELEAQAAIVADFVHDVADAEVFRQRLRQLNERPFPDYAYDTYLPVYDLKKRLPDTKPLSISTYMSSPAYLNILNHRLALSDTIKEPSKEQGQALSNGFAAERLLIKWVLKKDFLTVKDIKKLHHTLCQGLSNNGIGDSAAGVYRYIDVFGGGEDAFQYLPARLIEEEMNLFVTWLKESMELCQAGKIPPIILAAKAMQRLVSIHPFADGNGRTSEFVMDFILQKFGFPPPMLEHCLFGLYARISDEKNISQETLFYTIMEGILTSCKKLDLTLYCKPLIAADI